MSSIKNDKCTLVTTAWLTLGALFSHIYPAIGVTEARFDVLQTKTGLYTNVTVTSKTEEWIFIIHAGGMGNIKVSELTKDVQVELGFAVAEEKQSSNPIARLTMHELTDLNLPGMAQLEQSWREGGVAAVISTFGNPMAVWATLGILGLFYQFFCYCCMTICRRAHSPPGFLVWVPVLQIIPLLRAAGMSPMWFFALLVPGVNLLALFVWFVKIVDARGKGRLLVLWLVLPITSPFAFLYLAFSQVTAIKTEKQVLLMLETA